MFTEDSAMFVRFLFAAVLLTGCSAPVTRPSLSHSADYERGFHAGVDAARANPQGQRELRHGPIVNRTPGFVDSVDLGLRDTTWIDMLPNNQTGCLIALAVVAVVIIASATFWR